MQRGFTLIELLIVVAIIGIIAAIAIPALQLAVDKSKQRATMADMRSLGEAVAIYSVDFSIFPAPGTTAANLVQTVKQNVKTLLPSRDRWGHDFGYDSDGRTWYSVESFGKDGVDGVDISPATKMQFNLDTVYANGRFAAAPE